MSNHELKNTLLVWIALITIVTSNYYIVCEAQVIGKLFPSNVTIEGIGSHFNVTFTILKGANIAYALELKLEWNESVIELVNVVSQSPWSILPVNKSKLFVLYRTSEVNSTSTVVVFVFKSKTLGSASISAIHFKAADKEGTDLSTALEVGKVSVIIVISSRITWLRRKWQFHIKTGKLF